MEPLLLDVKSLLKDSIYVKELQLPSLEDQYHYHNAYEISYILKSTGRRVIGDNIENFTDGDLTFLAPLVPHISYSSQQLDISDASSYVHAVVVYFHPDWLTDSHFNSPELAKVREIFENMRRGIKIFGETKKKVVKNIMKLKTTRGLEQIITLLNILLIVSKSNEYACLASEGYAQVSNQKDEKRIDEVYRYVRENFEEKIKLDDIASIAHMTPTAFCKYFKARTKKTFSHFVNEVRIGHACKLLCKDDMNITQIAFECGFNNLTNFNKNFKQFKKMVPSEYKFYIQNKDRGAKQMIQS
jgi:AraC-like DNA-binding protein